MKEALVVSEETTRARILCSSERSNLRSKPCVQKGTCVWLENPVSETKHRTRQLVPILNSTVLQEQCHSYKPLKAPHGTLCCKTLEDRCTQVTYFRFVALAVTYT